MSEHTVRHGSEPVRMFRSDLLEYFSHIHPGVVLGVWLPVAVLFVALGVSRTAGVGWFLHVPPLFLLGLFLWTLAEYLLHRFVFHFRPRVKWQERVSFLFHGVHHVQPMCKTRLVMPPPVSVPLALGFYGLYWVLFAVLAGRPAWVPSVFAGTVTGYLLYDMMHYATHHFRLRSRALQFVRRHHLRHHGSNWKLRFGVSSPLWDYVFGTMPPDSGREASSPAESAGS